MKLDRRWLGGLVTGFVLALALSTGLHDATAQDAPAPTPKAPAPQHLGDPPGSRTAEIHQACLEGGCKVQAVCFEKGSYHIVMRPGCSSEEDARARRIMEGVLQRAPQGATKVKSVEEALLVLRFEPNNAQAQRFLRKRYRALRRAQRAGKAKRSPEPPR